MTNPQNDEYNPSKIQVSCLKQQTVGGRANRKINILARNVVEDS